MSNENLNGELEATDDKIVSVDESKTTKDKPDAEDVDQTIKYSTHQKLLNQRKKDQERIKELEEFRRSVEETEAKKKGDYETLLKSKDSKIVTLEEKLNNYERDLTEGSKLQAFINNLPGSVKREEYLSFVNLDEIAIDPDSKRVDDHSVKLAVDNFVKNYGDLLDKKEKNTLPQVNSLGGRPNKRRSLKELSRDELRQAYLSGDFES